MAHAPPDWLTEHIVVVEDALPIELCDELIASTVGQSFEAAPINQAYVVTRCATTRG